MVISISTLRNGLVGISTSPHGFQLTQFKKYMRDQTIPMWDGTVTELTTPRFSSITDYVATLRAAMSSPVAAIWWFNHRLRAHFVVSCALHYMSPWQTFSLQNAQPQPQCVDEALLGARQGEETG